MENLQLYNAFRSVPAEAQRAIQAGKLKGKTDINPQWRIEMLTQTFGPVGFGWVTRITKTWVDFMSVIGETGEASLWVILELRVKNPDTGEWSEPIEGTGGSKLYGKGQGSEINDEALKMAETDAISVACKKLGIAADIYWNESPTKFSTVKDEPNPVKPKPQATPVHEAPTIKVDDAIADVANATSYPELLNAWNRWKPYFSKNAALVKAVKNHPMNTEENRRAYGK